MPDVKDQLAAKLTVGADSLELPMMVGTEDEHAVDISQLRKKTGLITIDPGLRKHRIDDQRHHIHRW